MNTLKKAIILAAVPLSLIGPSAAFAVPATSFSNGQVLIDQADATNVKQVPVADVASFVSSSEKGADAFVQAAPGQSVTVQVTPAGCQDSSCGYQVTSETPASTDTATPAPTTPDAPAVAAPAQSLVAATGSTSVKVLSTSTLPEKPTLGILRGSSVIHTWRPITDKMCSRLGCIAWKMTLSSKAYNDRKVAWSNRRLGYAGSQTCMKKGLGFSVDDEACGNRNDPSATAMYDEYQAKVSGVVKGFPIYNDCYIHRHYSASGRSWGVYQC